MKHFPPLTVVAWAVFSVGPVASGQADQANPVVATFSQNDPGFSETIILYADGRYQQSETQKKVSFYRDGSLHLPLPQPASVDFQGDLKRSGTWCLRDQKDGKPLLLKPGAKRPPNAVIEMKGAMPFGMTWDNMPPGNLHGDRILPSALFQAAPLTVQSHNAAVIVLGSPLPLLLKH